MGRKWLSALLRAAGLPRHALRLRDSEEAQRETAVEILREVVPPDGLDAAAGDIVALANHRFRDDQVRHRAVEDAEQERQRWLAVCALAEEAATNRRAGA